MSSGVGTQGTTFSFRDGGKDYTLHLRHNPYNVTWTYNLNTNVVDTYTGQVVQILNVNIDSLTIEGQLGVEGAYGKKIVEENRLVDRDTQEHFDYRGTYPGLHGMVEFFRTYFAIQSQGADRDLIGRYTQTPMSLAYHLDNLESPYGGNPPRHWPHIIPYSFPSFRRAWDNYAPMWQIKAYVLEADRSVQVTEKNKALERIQNGIGYRVINPFVDNMASDSQVLSEVTNLLNGFERLLPAYSPSQLSELAWNLVSAPASAYLGTAGSTGPSSEHTNNG